MGTFDEDFQENFKKLIEDVAYIRKAIDESTTKINQLEQDNKILHEEVEELAMENYMLKNRIADMEQYSRKNNMIIRGIPKAAGEDLRMIVKKLATKLDMNISDFEIDTLHRLPSKNAIPAIIVKFTSRDTKNNFIRSAKKKKLAGCDIGFASVTPIYCDEQITTHTREILQKALEIKRENVVQYVWVRDGNVFVREKEGELAYKITCLEQLNLNNPQEGRAQTENGKEKQREEEPKASQKQGTSANLDHITLKGTPGKGPNTEKRTMEDRSPEDGHTTVKKKIGQKPLGGWKTVSKINMGQLAKGQRTINWQKQGQAVLGPQRSGDVHN